MKTLSIRNVLAVVIVGVLLGTAYFTNSGLLKARKAEAVAVPLTGYAWSLGTKVGSELADSPAGPYSTTAGSNPGIGWISFSSTNETGGQTYGVNVSQVLSIGTAGLGTLSGQAWSPNDPDSSGNPTGIGWVSFDRAVTGNPTLAWGDPGLSQAGTPLAYIDWTTGDVRGWARAIVACKDTNWNGTNCTAPTAGDKAGGWDGWIKLSGTWTGGVAVATDGTFSGKAWGGDIVGWIDFAPTSAGTNIVHLPATQTCSGTYVVPVGGCTPPNGCTPGDTVVGIGVGLCSDSGSTLTQPTTCTMTCPAPAPTPATTKTHFWQF